MVDTEQRHLLLINSAFSKPRACARQGRSRCARVLQGDLQRNSQLPVPSVSQCAHFELASLHFAVDLHEEQLGQHCWAHKRGPFVSPRL